MSRNQSRILISLLHHRVGWMLLGFWFGMLGKLCGAEVGWNETSYGRYRELLSAGAEKVGFTRLNPARSGILYSNHIDAQLLLQNQIMELGSGVALGDVDGDGRVDLFLGSMGGTSRMYRNLGELRFEDMTARSGVKLGGEKVTGVLLSDVDGDGDLDLLVNGIGMGTRLFRNSGQGVFEEVASSGLGRGTGSSSMAMSDLDGNGTLDLYVANYHSSTVKDRGVPSDLEAGWVKGKFVITRPEMFGPIFLRNGGVSLFELGEPDVCYLNDGAGHFTAQSWTGGMFLDAEGKKISEPPRDWGLSVSLRDLNGDGLPDIYVCNDFFNSVDRVWLNQGGGQFRAAPATMFRHWSMSSMSVDFSDIDRDGHDDVFVADMMSMEHGRRHVQRRSLVHVEALSLLENPSFQPEHPRNSLYLSQGGKRFLELAQYAGIEATDWTWSSLFMDVDLDGFEDLLLTAGNVRDANDADRDISGNVSEGKRRESRKPLPMLKSRLQVYRNKGDLTFESKGADWRFEEMGVAHGMACADLDQDGDLDLVVNTLDRNVEVYRNDAVAPRVAVQLVGRKPNIQGIDARVILYGGAVPMQTKVILSGGHYLSGSAPTCVFAAGPNEDRLRLEVRWPNGSVSEVNQVKSGRLYEIRQPDIRSEKGFGSKGAQLDSKKSLFAPWTPGVRSVHVSPSSRAFEMQPLNPRRSDRLGPGICWYDVDGDTWEDLVVGAGQGAAQVIYLSDGKGGFRGMKRPGGVLSDQSTVLAGRDSEGKSSLFIGSFVPEGAEITNAASVAYMPLEKPSAWQGIKGLLEHVGPMAIGVHQKHRVIFVGGFSRPGRVGEPVASMLLEERGGVWVTNTASDEVLRSLGVLTGATWTSLDSEPGLELIVSSWWGKVRVLGFQGDQLIDRTEHFGLDSGVGYWGGVDSGDFDGDGRLDLVVGNLGLNNAYRRHLHHPIRTYMGDWTQSGRWDVMEAYYEESLKAYVPFATLDRLRPFVPQLAGLFPTFAAYSRASVESIVGEEDVRRKVVSMDEFASCVFLNRGNHMEKRRLPACAQMAPVFGVSVGDLNGDGRLDLVMAQNEFGLDVETTRMDGGRGLVLKGDGMGGFVELSAEESGISLDGEMRATGLCDVDHDGRIDLAITQNRGALGLFRNVGAKPGMRVRVEGPEWNRDGLGVILRPVLKKGMGPAVLLRAGSGFWSQEALVQVLGGVEPVESIWVRWPLGEESTIPVTQGASELVIRWR